MACRLFRKAVQQGRSERRGESYFVPYVEPLSDARTMLADFVNSLLGLQHKGYAGSRLVGPRFGHCRCVRLAPGQPLGLFMIGTMTDLNYA
jgi:hypothetical protein